MPKTKQIVELLATPSTRLLRAVKEFEGANSVNILPFPGTIAGLAAELDMKEHKSMNNSFKAERLAYAKSVFASNKQPPSILEISATVGMAMIIAGIFSLFI